MKIRTVNILEIILSVIFIAFYFLKKTDVVNLRWIGFISFMMLGILYFPLGFYTLKSPKLNLIYSVGYGMLFSCSLVSIFYSLLKVDISVVLLMMFIIIFLMLAAIEAAAISLFGQPNGKIIQYDTGLTIRYLVILFFMVYALVTYNFNN
jgi:hypothetical protein